MFRVRNDILDEPAHRAGNRSALVNGRAPSPGSAFSSSEDPAPPGEREDREVLEGRLRAGSAVRVGRAQEEVQGQQLMGSLEVGGGGLPQRRQLGDGRARAAEAGVDAWQEEGEDVWVDAEGRGVRVVSWGKGEGQSEGQET